MEKTKDYFTGADTIVHRLKREGVDLIFAYIGGSVIPLFDALGRHSETIRLIRPNHEQAGVHAADGYARACGRPGVVITTSGPGALNTLTGIATAFMDSVPLVVITGQVALGKIGSDAFQESDIVGMSAAVTKGSRLVRHIEQLDETLKWAFDLAMSGRKGPVLVDIPVDIQMQTSYLPIMDVCHTELRSLKPAKSDMSQFWLMLKEARSPLLLSGGGVISSDCAAALARFAERSGIPVVSTLLGRGLPLRRPELDLGGIGMHGSLYANLAVHHADLLIVCGSRLSDRILGDVKSFAAQGRIVQVDIDPAEIGKIKAVDLGIVASLSEFTTNLMNTEAALPDYSSWLSRIDDWRELYPLQFEKCSDCIKPQHLLQQIQKRRDYDSILVTDVGQNQMWASQFMQIRRPRTLLTSGGLGTMGYALPAAIGAQLACPGKQVLALCGDGGFAMNLQELETLWRIRLPVKLVVLDNHSLGMVRQWQNLLCAGRHVETDLQTDMDYEGLGRAFGLWSRSTADPKTLAGLLDEFFACSGPAMLHVQVDAEEHVLPMVPLGAAINEALTHIQHGN